MKARNLYFFVTILLTDVLLPGGLLAISAENVSELSGKKTLSLPSDSGPIQAIAYEKQFRVRYNSRDAHDVVGLFVAVPSRKISWLGYAGVSQPNQSETDRKFFVLGDKIVAVATSRGDHLDFYISSEPVGDDLEQSAIKAFEEKFALIGSRFFDIRENSFRMEDVLGLFPFFRLGNAQGEPAPKITNIEVKPGQFTLTFRGGRENDIEATITFASDFRPISATLQGKQVYPKPASPSPTR